MKIILITFILSFNLYANTEIQTLFRCYSQLTNTKLSPSSSYITDIKNGTKTATQVCSEIIENVNFTAEVLTDNTNQEHINILDTFQRLHYSWFITRDYSSLDGNRRKAFSDLMTPENISTRITRALFLSGVSTDSILTGSILHEPVRSNGEPVNGIFSNDPKSEYFYGNENSSTDAAWAVTFPDIGDIQGFKTHRHLETPYTLTGGSTTTVYSQSLGGGLLGHPGYVAMNADVATNYQTDGAQKVVRKWAVAVYSDFLCKDMPNLRFTDIAEYIKEGSSVPFRQNATCVNCHASMDQMAGVLRNFRTETSISKGGNPPKMLAYKFRSPSKGHVDWPDEANSDYKDSDPEGKLYYRSFKGDLVSINVSNIEDLGQTIVQQEDFFYCMTSKYLKYFTGVDVKLNDHYQYELSTSDKYYKNIIIELGDQFKQSKDPKELIKSIMNHSIYQKPDFGNEESKNE